MTANGQYPLGRIEVITGCMFSGKSSELLTRYSRYVNGHGCRTCLIRSHVDTRAAATHDGQRTFKTDFYIGNHMDKLGSESTQFDTVVEYLIESITTNDPYQVVAIDEAQFMPDLARQCTRLANAGMIVLVAALDLTFTGDPFPEIPALLALADRVDKRTAFCRQCKRDAARYSRRLTPGQALVEIGGADRYEPLCRACIADTTMDAVD